MQNQALPLWVGLQQSQAAQPFAVGAASAGPLLAVCLLKREREKDLCWRTFLSRQYQDLIHMGVKGSKAYSVLLIASLHLLWKPENRWSSDFPFPLWWPVFKNRGVVLPWLLVTALPKLQGTVCPCVNWTQLFPTLSFSFLCSFVSHSNSTPGYCTVVGNLLGHLARLLLEPFVVASFKFFFSMDFFTSGESCCS